MNADRKKIWINGQLIEVTDEVYAAYMKGDRKIRYFETDLKVERIVLNEDETIKKIIPSREDSLDRLVDDHAAQYAVKNESVENVVLYQIEADKLHTALSKLSKEEQNLIYALFFEEQTEREYAEHLSVYRNAVHARKIRILKKLKKILE